MYNEEDNHIDELFRSAFKGHEETPPASAWNNIAETRSFGHILLNQIALNWKNFLFMTIGFMFIGAAVVGFGTDNNEDLAEIESSYTNFELYGGHDFGGMLLAYNSPEGIITKNGVSSYYGNAINPPFDSYGTISKLINSLPTTNYKKEVTTYYEDKAVGPFNNKEEITEQVLNQPIKKDNTPKILKSTKTLNKNKAKALPITHTDKATEQVKASDRKASKVVESASETKASKVAPGNIFAAERFIRQLGFVPPLKSSKINKVSRSKAAEPIMVDSLYFNRTMRKRFPMKNHLYASFKFGPELMNKELKTNSSENNAYLNSRNQSEKSLIGGSVQANLTYYFYNRVFIETGFRYSQARERATYSTRDIVGERTVYDSLLTGFQVGPTGDPIPIYDITSRTEFDEEIANFNHTNTYHMIDIPLLLGYQVDIQRWSVYFKSGISATVLRRNSGYLLNEDGNSSIDLGTNNDPFDSGVVLNLELAGGVSYQLDENISFLLEPSFRSTINNLYNSDYPLLEKRKIIGINTGIRFKL